MSKPLIGFDLEWTSDDPLTASIASIQVYNPTGEHGDEPGHLFIPIKCCGRDEPPDKVAGILQEIADRYRVVGFNLYGDLMLCQRYGVTIEPAFDGFLYFSNTPLTWSVSQKERGLKDLCKHLNIEGYFQGKNLLSFKQAVPSLRFQDVTEQDTKAIHYAMDDPYLAWRFYELMSQKYPANLESHADDMAAMNVFVSMTLRGIPIDTSALPQIEAELSARLALLNKELAELAGGSFRPNSNKDLVPVFERKGWELPPKTESGQYSFKEENLKTYLPNPMIEKIIEARQLIYIIPRIHNTVSQYSRNGKLYPEYKLVGWSGGGRVYTASPSTNSLPMAVRNYCKAPKGRKYIYADWKQAEFILTAQMAGQDDIVHGYFEGEDVMTLSAAKNFHKPAGLITEKERETQKTVHYASMYGSEGESVAKALQVSSEVGRQLVRDFWNSLPEMNMYRQAVIETAHAMEYTETLTGFKRFIPNINSEVKSIREEAERRAFNTAQQSGVAYLFKRALVKIHANLPSDCELVTGVFDSFLIEVPEDLDPEVLRPLIQEASTFEVYSKAWRRTFNIKFMFSLQEGASWGEAQSK